jgi:hypothetical protein
MKNKSLMVVVVILLVGAYFVWVYANQSAPMPVETVESVPTASVEENPSAIASDTGNDVPTKETSDTSQELTLSEEQLALYRASYEDPFVLHVRKALNGYLSGTYEGMDSPDTTIGKWEDKYTGLASFDVNYYRSKFAILSVDDSSFGGKDITLIFQDKPDKIFSAWVYKYPDAEKYDMRGFSENVPETLHIDETLAVFRKYVFDKEYSL